MNNQTVKGNKMVSTMQEMKKIIPQPVAEADNFYMARPTTSNSRQISNRSINGGFGSASHINRKYSRGFNNTSNYTALGTSIRRENRKSQASKIPVFRLNRDNTTSVVSLFSGPLSP